tara:strand:+ start:12715 stop:14730 length:2016 start_codon:yes stop_codon:yes gene_type:complete
MRTIKFLSILLFTVSSANINAQDLFVKSDLEGLKLNIGETFEPETYAETINGERVSCPYTFYYNKQGVFSRAKAISYDRNKGEIKANAPGKHEVVAICLGLKDQRLSRTFEVEVDYAMVKEITITVPKNNYVNTYLDLNFDVLDSQGFKRDGQKLNITSSSEILQIDNINNVKAVGSGSAILTAELDGVSASVEIDVLENPLAKIVLSSNQEVVRTGDVVQHTAKGFDMSGNEIKNLPFEYTFYGKSFDVSESASGTILNDGRFVAEEPGEYSISATLGDVTSSKPLRVVARDIKREVFRVGNTVVPDKRTSDFWIFEGIDGRDYAVTGTHSADGTAFFWDVTDPSNMKKIDSIKVDARTVNDVKVSQDGKIAIISREGASNRKNGIFILDVTNPYDVKVLSEYTKNLTGGVHNLFIDNDHAYVLGTGERYYILNIEDPSNPVEVGMFEVGSEGQNIHDVWIEDGIAYSSNWRDGVYLVDVGNGVAGGSPSNPVAFANYTYASGANHAAFPFRSNSTGKFYVVACDEIFPDGVQLTEPEITAGFCHFVDFTDLDNPVEVAKFEVPGTGSHNLWVEDDVLYVAMYGGGVRVVDISGDLVGDLFRQDREIGYTMTGSPNGFIPNATMAWGAQVYKGYVFYSDMHSGLGVAKVSEQKPDTSNENQYIENTGIPD